MKKINIVLWDKKRNSLFLFFSVMMLPFMTIDNTFAADYTLTLTSSGSQSIDIAAAGTKTAISADSINVSTTCRYGYNFTINTSVNDNNLYLNGNSSNNQSDTYFTPSNGIASLKDNPNSWGYYYNSASPTTAPSANDIFSPVPTLVNPTTVKTPLSTPASSDISDNFKIYYGVNSASNMGVGTYKMIPDTNNSNNDGTIVYTATIAKECLRYTVHFDPTGTNVGTSITGTGTVDDQTMYEGIAANLTNSYFTGPTIGSTTYYFAGWNTAQDGSGTQYTKGQSVTDLSSAGNTVTLYAQWTDCPANRICYDANVSNLNDVEGEMGDQTISSSATSVIFYAPNFSRADYGFAGWNTRADGTGTNYGPQSTIEFTAGAYSGGGLKLYAKWIASAGNMQGWTGCSSMSIGDITARKDTRDNNVYAIAKLADGKCWMIENLRLADKDSNNNDVILSSSNTHNPSLPLTNSWWYSSANDGDTKPTSNHLSVTTDPTSTAWCNTHSSDCDDQSMLNTDNITFFTNNVASSYSAGSNVYSYGTYYNWYSATAGHGRYSSSTGFNAPGDICPAGWHLPTGKDATSEFGVLDLALGGTGQGESGSAGKILSKTYRSYPNNFILSGGLSSSSISNRNSSGSYWSSSANTMLYNYSWFINASQATPSVHLKYSGKLVRCIAGT